VRAARGVRGPGPAEIGERLAEVQAWATDWERAARGPLRVEYRQVGGRLVGANQLPGRAWIDGYARAWELLGARRQVSGLVRLASRAKAECSPVLPWLERNPVRTLQLAADSDRLLATVRWVDSRDLTGRYIRQVDVPGVDTKFIEGHKSVAEQAAARPRARPPSLPAAAPPTAGPASQPSNGSRQHSSCFHPCPAEARSHEPNATIRRDFRP
jgi:hypothetical protein